MKASCLALRWACCGLLFSAATCSFSRGQTFVRIESEPQRLARERIEAALSRIGDADYLDTPLVAVAGDLESRLGVNIVLAARTLADAAVTTDTPVTASISGVSYASLLRLILQELDLAWTIRDEVILITTEEDAESILETRLYPVRDLVGAADGGSKYGLRDADYDTLIDAIVTTVEPDSWEEVGGPGTVVEYPNAGALLVTQTGEIHEKVDDLLAALRRLKRLDGIELKSAPSRSGPAARRIRARSPSGTSPLARRHAAAPAEAWQLPRLHAAE